MMTEVAAAQDAFAELIEQLTNGDDAAMGELARRYGPGMVVYADRMLGPAMQSQHDPEDVVQSALITLWLGVRAGKFTIERPPQFVGLAKTLIRRQLSRMWRKSKSEINVAQSASMMDTIVDQQIVPVAPAEDGPHRQAEFENLMETFLSELTDTDRALVNLRFRGFTTADAAIMLQMDPAHLRVRLSRLRKKLAELRGDISESE